MSNLIRPPLGLRPWWVDVMWRKAEIEAAIKRYRLCRVKPPRSWRIQWYICRFLLWISPCPCDPPQLRP